VPDVNHTFKLINTSLQYCEADVYVDGFSAQKTGRFDVVRHESIHKQIAGVDENSVQAMNHYIRQAGENFLL
jgi:hypothetical protein